MNVVPGSFSLLRSIRFGESSAPRKSQTSPCYAKEKFSVCFVSFVVNHETIVS